MAMKREAVKKAAAKKATSARKAAKRAAPRKAPSVRKAVKKAAPQKALVRKAAKKAAPRKAPARKAVKNRAPHRAPVRSRRTSAAEDFSLENVPPQEELNALRMALTSIDLNLLRDIGSDLTESLRRFTEFLERADGEPTPP